MESLFMPAIAKAQPNIALIKYWGKRDTKLNLPAVGSISITLSELFTEMSVELDGALPGDQLTVNGADNDSLLPRVRRCLDSVLGEQRQFARVVSRSNFPIAAGLASSASAFSALVVAANSAGGRVRCAAELANLAGANSGSAARSLYGGFVELENHGNEVKVASICESADWPLRVVVAVTSTGPKATSSGEAMEISRRTSPFYSRWVDQQPQDLDDARAAIEACDFEKLATVAEHNCLKMHSVMWASRPPVMFWNSATIECMQVVRELRSQGVAVFFTIDAGPQLKAVCLPEDETDVSEALAATAGVRKIMTSGLGGGASLVAST
jgi:diphosphomevalonate decarboxylase